MDEFLKFICDNSHVIIESVLTLVVLFVTLFKKKVKVVDYFELVFAVLPDFIKEAEASYTVGSEKYSYVFHKCIDLLVYLTKQPKSKVVDLYTNIIDKAIENILSAPQKKER